jgi:hypothetical protein
MVYINLLIIILIILMTVLGRKNKSKYKARLKVPGLEKLFLRTKVMTEKKAREAAADFVMRAITVCMVILFSANFVALIYGLSRGDEAENTENTITRQEYDGDESSFDLKLTDSEGEEIYTLKVAPLEYTKEEFDARTEEIFEELRKNILGGNESLDHITTDMCLSDYDESGVVHLSWSSDQPGILSSDGRLDNLSISEGVAVRLDVSMEYGEYERDYSYDVYVEPAADTGSESGLESAKSYVENLEKEGRTKRECTVPSDVSGVHIALVEEEDYTQVKIVILGICVCVLCVGIRYFDLKEKGDRVDEELEASYVGFVESLTLLIESGMTVKKAVSHLSAQAHMQGKLSDELKYAINMVDTGYDEVYAYEQLGMRLALPEYVRLFNYISQNIRKGNSNLKAVLNNCAYEAAQTGRENIRKRGEKTSTKLLFPMVMLLMAVMLIIIVPALISF